MAPTVDWLVLQLADSAFPTGAFAHSGGLEAAVQCGETSTAARLDAHVRAHLWNAGSASLPFAAAAHDDPSAAGDLDALADALLSNHVANRASRTQGRAFLLACARVFDEPVVAALASRARAGAAPAHLAPMFGATLAALGVGRREALALYLYGALRCVVSAAVRLGVVGPHEAQRLQRRHAATLDEVLARCERLPAAEAATVAPLLDLIGATHDRLYTRLFQS